jgi:hypothetical protein
VRELALEECRRQGAYFLSPEEMQKVTRLVFLPGSHTPNTQIVGRAATVIAEMAGIKVPHATRVLIARLEPEQVGREFPLSAEKLSPILAFYAAPNLAAGIALCRRLLEFGGLGHTCSIHSQNRSAILEFGEAMPAFRVVVNSASVYGSIGYSTNLFPAMTLGCGAPGGNITSDNIGPQHLMNVKRIAWESRGVEHRTVPADQRMAGAANLPEPEAIMARASVPVAAPAPPVSAPSIAALSPGAAQVEKKLAAPAATPAVLAGSVDRAAIARLVETVLVAQGIARGSGAPKSMPAPAPTPAPASKEIASPSSIAAEIADRFFKSAAKAKPEGDEPPSPASSSVTQVANAPAAFTPAPSAAKKPEPPAKLAVEIQVFVSENDVRRAMTRSEKIFIGRKTILTPSARDLGLEHEVFVETEAGSIR